MKIGKCQCGHRKGSGALSTRAKPRSDRGREERHGVLPGRPKGAVEIAGPRCSNAMIRTPMVMVKVWRPDTPRSARCRVGPAIAASMGAMSDTLARPDQVGAQAVP